jgi:predicted amidophosphoribosyltransferase
MRGGDQQDETLCDFCGRKLNDYRRVMCDDCKDKIWRAVYGRVKDSTEPDHETEE